MYRAAIIGCGKIGSEFADDPKQAGTIFSHAPAYADCADTNLVAVCDIDRERAIRCGKRWNVTSYTDYLEMLPSERPDIVSVCTPDETHHGITRDLLDMAYQDGYPKGILLEKPVALTSREAVSLFYLADCASVVVNYKRYVSCRLREAIKDIGEPIHVRGLYSGGLLHNGTHWIDLARYLIGEIDRANGTDILFESGCTGTLDGFPDLPYSLFEMDIIGDGGRMILKDMGHCVKTYLVRESDHYSGYMSLHPYRIVRDCMKYMTLNAVKDLVRCMDTGKEPLCSLYDGLRAIEVAEDLARQT